MFNASQRGGRGAVIDMGAVSEPTQPHQIKASSRRGVDHSERLLPLRLSHVVSVLDTLAWTHSFHRNRRPSRLIGWWQATGTLVRGDLKQPRRG